MIPTRTYKEPYETFYKLNVGLSLDEYETEEAMTKILYEPEEQKRIILMTTLLNGIMIKGPTINEISGLLNASLGMDEILVKDKLKLKVPENEILVGVAGSGKKGIKTINITSTACFVAAACGVNIAKACSHSTSSKTGSSDFLDLCGIDINIPFKKKQEILDKYHISFFSIEDTTPKFAEVYGGVFYIPHAMSFALAGLSFPVEIDALAYGLAHPNVKLSAEVLKKYGINNALVYSLSCDGVHYLDELLPVGSANLVRIKDGEVQKTISADIQEGLNITSSFDLKNVREKESKAENVATSLRILKGEGSECQIDSICVNAAVFLLLAKKVESLDEGYHRAKDVLLNSNKVWDTFLNVVELYGGNKEKVFDLIK